MARRAAAGLSMALLAAATLAWLWTARAPGPYELASPAPLAQAALHAAACAALGWLAYALSEDLPALEGLALGAFLGVVGAQAAGWVRVCQAWRHLGWFAGQLLPYLLVPALAATAAAGAWLLRRRRLGWLAGLLLIWGVGARAAAWRLSTRHYLRAPSLAADAGLPPPSRAESVSLAWLHPWQGADARYEEKQALAAGVDLSPESLEKLGSWLEARDLRGVFAKQALAALRQGWLFWWEADRALDAAMLRRDGRVAPDYKTALGLLRAGAIDDAHYRKLEALSEAAQDRRLGFEDVLTSQLIFEGFASAFARFGDEQSARPWLTRIDRLWPIYEKKIEVTPVETSHDGRLEGTLLLDGRPATGIKVGLFYVAGSSPTLTAPGFLSGSDFPDQAGRFAFASLAPGTYYLGLMGLPGQLRGRVRNSPGLVRLEAGVSPVVLDPIRVEP